MAHHRVPVVLLSLVAAFVLGPRIACATCGDGILDPGEECDPGPDVEGDCCTSTCTIMATCPAPDECHDAGSCDLYQLEPGNSGTFVRVSDADPEMLRFLTERGISPGARLEVLERQPFDGPLSVRVGRQVHVLGAVLARAIRVQTPS